LLFNQFLKIIFHGQGRSKTGGIGAVLARVNIAAKKSA
jgi:hypothetical protein